METIDLKKSLVVKTASEITCGFIKRLFFLMALLFAFLSVCGATTYTITDSQSPSTVYSIIDSLQPSDIVEFAPGKYEYRICFSRQSGNSLEPIILRAQDPNNRPVFDLSGDGIWSATDNDWIGNWPGNCGSSDRAIWQFTNVAYYEVSDIVFRGAHQGATEENGSAIRIVANVNYGSFAHHISFRNCLFEDNDNGVQGGGDDILYEYCEFRSNGATDVQVANGADGTHNMYIHGGDLTVRYCHFHNPLRGQNFHLRSKTALFEYNLIEHGFNYMGDIMTNMYDRANGDAITQELTLLGNVIIEKTDPGNNSKVFSFYNDQNWPNTSMRLNMYYNTIIGNGDGSALLRIYDDANVPMQEAFIYNNIFYNVHRPFNIESGLTATDYHLETRNNWWPSGYDYSPYAAFMSDSIFGTILAFNDPGSKDYSLTASSEVKDVADTSISGLVLPQYEYNQNGLATNVALPRTSALSLGAFEYSGNAPTPINGACGADNGQILSSTPTRLCRSGSATTPNLSNDVWTWDCLGVNGGTDASPGCQASSGQSNDPGGAGSGDGGGSCFISICVH